MQDLKPTIWPLLFTHKGSVFGNGFLADIELCGRLLAEPNAEGVWLYGVKPGALAVGAVNLATANTELLKALVAVFVDFAEESKTFGQFKSMVEQYFNEGCVRERQRAADGADQSQGQPTE